MKKFFLTVFFIMLTLLGCIFFYKLSEGIGFNTAINMAIASMFTVLMYKFWFVLSLVIFLFLAYLYFFQSYKNLYFLLTSLLLCVSLGYFKFSYIPKLLQEIKTNKSFINEDDSTISQWKIMLYEDLQEIKVK